MAARGPVSSVTCVLAEAAAAARSLAGDGGQSYSVVNSQTPMATPPGVHTRDALPAWKVPVNVNVTRCPRATEVLAVGFAWAAAARRSPGVKATLRCFSSTA